jgi:branched-chain amino acid transport system substrate-binding protein
MFGTLAPNGGLVDAMLKTFPAQLPQVKKIAILGREDVFPRSMAATMKDAAEKAGMQVVHNELYPVGSLDHSASLSRIKASGADWIYVTGYSKDLILARKQMADLGVTAPVITMITGPAYQEFIDALGPLAEGITSTTWWHHSSQYVSKDVWGSTKAFYEEFKAREKHDPDYVHASSAVALVVLQMAIEKAGTLDKAKVRDALASMDAQTFFGPIKFGPNGMNAGRELPIIQVQNKKVAVLFPQAVKQANLVPVAATKGM